MQNRYLSALSIYIFGVIVNKRGLYTSFLVFDGELKGSIQIWKNFGHIC